MIRRLLLALALCSIAVPASALSIIPLSHLPTAAPAGGDLVPFVHSGITSKATWTQVLALTRPLVFDVTSAQYGAKCDGSTDDTTPIQNAEIAAAAAAAASGNAVVYLPSWCAISTGIAWDSNVELRGSGMYASGLKALSSFHLRGDERTGQNGKLTGMLWLDGPTLTTPITGVTIRDVGFDPRAGTQSFALTGFGTYHAVLQQIRPIQNFLAQNVYFDLGANSSSYIGTSLGPKGFLGFSIESLGYDPANPSHDLVFRHIVGHNGDGTIQLALAGQGTAPTAYNITLDDISDAVDLNYIDDDRVAITGVSASGRGELYGITANNLRTFVAPSVTIGGINELKVDPGSNTTIDRLTVDDIHFVGSPNGAYGSPLGSSARNGTGSPLALVSNSSGGVVRDYVARKIFGQNSLGLSIFLGAESGQTVNSALEDVTLLNCYDKSAAVYIASFVNGSGKDRVTLSGFKLVASSAATAVSSPQAVEFNPVAGGNGATGAVAVKDGVSIGYPTPITAFAGFDNMAVSNFRWDAGSPSMTSAATFTNTTINLTANANYPSALSFPNPNGVGHFTQIGSDNTKTLNTITGGALAMLDNGVPFITQDFNGNFAVKGGLYPGSPLDTAHGGTGVASPTGTSCVNNCTGSGSFPNVTLTLSLTPTYTTVTTGGGGFVAPPSNTATSGTTDYSSQTYHIQDSHWNGSAAVTEDSTIKSFGGQVQMNGIGGFLFQNNGSSVLQLTQFGITLIGSNAGISSPAKITSNNGVCPGGNSTSGTPCFYSGSGTPSFSAPNGSQYANYAGTAGTRRYDNECASASTSCNTWVAKE